MTAQIDWEKVDQLLVAGCNGLQCAASIGVHYDTLARHCKSDKNSDFAVYMQEKRAHGDAMLLAAQYHKALKDKHPTMLVWLGKQRLHQKDSVEQLSQSDKDITEALKQINCFEVESLQNKIIELKNKINELEPKANSSNTASKEEI